MFTELSILVMEVTVALDRDQLKQY